MATFETETVNGEADSIARKLDGGYLRIYDASSTLLAECRFASTSAPDAIDGVLTFNSIASDTDNAASGVASQFCAFKSDGTSPILRGTVGEEGAGCDCTINSVAVQIHAQTDVTGFGLVVSKS